MTGMLFDLRHALRSLRQRLGFSLLVIVTMGFGIGATVAVYSYLTFFFLRPTVEAPDPERVVWLYTSSAQRPFNGCSYPDWLDLARNQEVFSQLVGFRVYGVAVADEHRSLFAWGHAVSGDYFGLFGVRAELGRLLGPEDDQAGAPRVVVLNNFFWQRHFGGDPAIIGRTLHLNSEHPYTVVGVTRPGFQGQGIATEIYIPLASAEAIVGNLSERETRRILTLARLRPEISQDRAEARLTALAAGLDQAFPETEARRFTLRSFAETGSDLQDDPFLDAAKVLMVVVVLLLLLAVANVANLLLARAVARRREMGTWRLIGFTGRITPAVAATSAAHAPAQLTTTPALRVVPEARLTPSTLPLVVLMPITSSQTKTLPRLTALAR